MPTHTGSNPASLLQAREVAAGAWKSKRPKLHLQHHRRDGPISYETSLTIPSKTKGLVISGFQDKTHAGIEFGKR
jgi:hypothetical protein